MKVSTRSLDEITPYARNPRRNDAAIDKVAASLKEFGWRQPIVVDEDGVILAGHTRYAAARRLGMKEAPVHVAEGLSAAQARAYRIMDNSSAEFASWDEPRLLSELDSIADDFSPEFFGLDIDEDDDDTLIDGWDFSETVDESVITIRSRINLQAEIRDRLRGLEGVTIEASYLTIEA